MTPPEPSAALAQCDDDALVREVLRAFYRVYNGLGHGFLESVYAGALGVELRERGVPFAREVRLAATYRGEAVGWFRADLVVGGRLVVELKASARPHPADRAQLVNYLSASSLRCGLLLHFGEEPFFWRVRPPGERRRPA